MRQPKLYVIGSLRNPQVPLVAQRLRTSTGFEVFDDWFAAGPEADDYWRDYEKARGHTFTQALKGYSARNVYAFDKRHLDDSDCVVLVLPAGKSGHLELGYMLGQRKWGAILLEEEDPERFDVMYQFADLVTSDVHLLIQHLDVQHYNITEMERDRAQTRCS